MSAQVELCRVQSKIPCIFESIVIQCSNCESKSGKRPRQKFSVEASDTLKVDFVNRLQNCSLLATEKVDGTSVLIKSFNNKPWLWARHDRKLTKTAEKHHKKLLECLQNGTFDENLKSMQPIPFNEDDFKEAPESWEPSISCVNPETSQLIPDTNGHIMGWVPVPTTSRQYCWHLDTVDLTNGLALMLQPDDNKDSNGYTRLKISIESMEDMMEQTFELVGTNINGNPYNLGSKKKPIHFLVRHGVLKIKPPLDIGLGAFKDWFESNQDGSVEGIVWHCSDGSMYKLHRHHLKLNWPISNTKLCNTPVEVQINPKSAFSKTARSLVALENNHYESMLALTTACNIAQDI